MTIDVLSVMTTTDRRGAEVFAVELGRSLQELGRSVRSVALVPGRGRGLDVENLGNRRLGPATLTALRRESRAAGLVIAHGSTTLPACAIATTGTGTPFIYRSIGDPWHWSASPARRARTRVLLQRATAVVALSSTAADGLTGRFRVPSAKIHVIPGGVSARDYAPADGATRAAARAAWGLPEETPVVVYLGALSVEKDVALGIDAVASLPAAHLVIAGDGPERAALEARAAARSPRRVRFLGVVHNPASVLAGADAVVLPSRTEGLPSVLIEAGMCALPVAATDVGFVRDIVVDGETGRLAPAGDVAALGRALAEVLRDGKAFGEAARARCLARYELGIVAGAWHGLIGSLLDRDHPSTSKS